MKILEFIGKNKQITSIDLYAPVAGNLDRLLEHEHISSNIEELSILQYSHSTNECGYRVEQIASTIFRFIKQSQSLKIFTIKGSVQGAVGLTYFDRIYSFIHIYDVITSYEIQSIIHNESTNKNKWCYCVDEEWSLEEIRELIQCLDFTIEKEIDASVMKCTCTFERFLTGYSADSLAQDIALPIGPYLVIECRKIAKLSK